MYGFFLGTLAKSGNSTEGNGVVLLKRHRWKLPLFWRLLSLCSKPPLNEEGNEEGAREGVAQGAVFWIETSDSVSRHYQFHSNGDLSMKVVDDSRTVLHRVVESFLNKFFPSGYPYSVNEGYLRYTQFRALQHFSSAALSVLSTQCSRKGFFSFYC
ncbi:Protein root UVB sensitive 2, chloroplastic [Vitis vinifera]|uniref:Protein root UVB sensitive 2, chloroplastic n=1 Tax=Vitis vinifera TaxID=29760 RepID=A0A438CMY7_VITVI|nr:Protein root UVB sensitive 2, chloroplastic [Vitis vinifera]